MPEFLVVAMLAAGCLLAILTSTQNTPAQLAGMLWAMGVAVLPIFGRGAMLLASHGRNPQER